MNPSGELKRSLGLPSAVLIVVGSVIGSGIFMKPLDIARSLPSVAWIYGTWAALGTVCLFGAFAFAELGGLLPDAGGQYVFLREGFGRLPAFLYAWCQLLVVNSGTLSALAVAFAHGMVSVGAAPPAAEIPVAISMICALALVNHFGVAWGAALQNLTTVTKLVALFAIVLGGFAVPGVEVHVAPKEAAATPDVLTGVATAAVAIFWAFEGWHQLPFNAAELKNPARDLPRGLLGGVAALIVTYIAVNAAYLHVVPLGEMRGLSHELDVPRTAVLRAFGPQAAAWLTLLVSISVFGAGNPNLLSTPRAMVAVAKDGLLPSALMRVHPTFRTPVLAIWSQAAWAIVLLVVLRNFRDITEYVVFAANIFYGLAVASVYALRRKMPHAERPFRCIGYPVTPAVFIAVVAFVNARMLTTPATRTNALVGLAILATALPVFVVAERLRLRVTAR